MGRCRNCEHEHGRHATAAHLVSLLDLGLLMRFARVYCPFAEPMGRRPCVLILAGVRLEARVEPSGEPAVTADGAASEVLQRKRLLFAHIECTLHSQTNGLLLTVPQHRGGTLHITALPFTRDIARKGRD